MSTSPSMIRLVKQNGYHRDCGVACLATLFGVTYDESLVACSHVAPDVLELGMTWAQIRRAAERLGADTKMLPRGRYDIEDATGLLNVKSRAVEHVVFLWAGRVLEGNGELWLDPDDYFRQYKVRPYSLLVRAE